MVLPKYNGSQNSNHKYGTSRADFPRPQIVFIPKYPQQRLNTSLDPYGHALVPQVLYNLGFSALSPYSANCLGKQQVCSAVFQTHTRGPVIAPLGLLFGRLFPA